MVKVCEDEDKNDDDAKRELQELQDIPSRSQQSRSLKRIETPDLPSSTNGTRSQILLGSSKSFRKSEQPKSKKSSSKERAEESNASTSTENEENNKSTKPRSSVPHGPCPICSVANDSAALTCIVCSNVLKPEFVLNFWRCKSSTCKDGDYINAGDVGLCGICGKHNRVPQILSPHVLRHSRLSCAPTHPKGEHFLNSLSRDSEIGNC
jgi:hypothetical protein